MILGKAIVDTLPYSLFPPTGYFSGFFLPPNSLPTRAHAVEVTPSVALICGQTLSSHRKTPKLCSYKGRLI